jgi:hypothetical protein
VGVVPFKAGQFSLLELLLFKGLASLPVFCSPEIQHRFGKTQILRHFGDAIPVSAF